MNKNYPKSWKDINLEQYIEILRTSEMEFEKPRDKEVKLISIITGLDKKEIYDLELKDYNKLQNTFSFIESDPGVEEKDHFIIDDIKYKAESNLQKVTTGEFLDLQGLTKNKEDIFDNFPLLLAIFYRPVVKVKKGVLNKEVEERVKFNLDDVYERKDLFLERLNAVDVWNCIGFFLHLKMEFLTRINQYFLKKNKKK